MLKTDIFGLIENEVLILLLTDNIVRKESYEKEQLEIKSHIQTLAELVKQGFEHMDKRFEAVESRLTELSRRMFQFML